MYPRLRFSECLHDRPTPTGIDVLCKLQHFAIVTYAIPPERLSRLIPPRFRLDCVNIGANERALMSVVPFIDIDFTAACFPFPKFTMGQTNYRVYVIDTQTEERCVWFLGTTLDSWTVMVPRLYWNLPWHPGTVSFDCEQDATSGRYLRYRMQTKASWGPASLELAQPNDLEICSDGFPDQETALVYLTHPLAGFYHRRDGKLGTYRVWHSRLMVSAAQLVSANFGLLSRLGLVSVEEQQHPHSVLLEPISEFTIYLPPRVLK